MTTGALQPISDYRDNGTLNPQESNLWHKIWGSNMEYTWYMWNGIQDEIW